MYPHQNKTKAQLIEELESIQNKILQSSGSDQSEDKARQYLDMASIMFDAVDDKQNVILVLWPQVYIEKKIC